MTTHNLSLVAGSIDGTSEFTPIGRSSKSNPYGGTVRVTKLAITVNGETDINMIGHYSSISIQEDLFSSSIVGSIAIIDTSGFLEGFKIRGGETLKIKIAGADEATDIIIWREDLIVHKISASKVDSLSLNSAYELYFTSRSHVNSLKKSIFKSYSGVKYIDAIRSVYSEMSVNDLIVEDPELTLTKPFVSTGLMPHRAMEFLAQRSCKDDRYYVFFERLIPVFGTKKDGKPFAGSHYFGSIEALIEESKNVVTPTIYFFPKLDARLEDNSIIRTPVFERDQNFNHVQAMLLGFYNTTITTIDPISRTHSLKKFGYTTKDRVENDLYDYKLVDEDNIFSTYNDFKGEVPGRKLTVSSVNDTGDRSVWMPSHINGQISKNMFKVRVEIQGGTNDIGVGNIVNLYIPSQIAKVSDAGNPFPPKDDMYSGKYFVVAVDHRFRDGEYIKALTLSRGSSPTNQDAVADGRDTINFTQDTATARIKRDDSRYANDLDNSSIVENWRNNKVPE